ncbi:Multidrug resistance protein MdtG [Candidatus Anstonella stagnisolia]|nr:Multidrug resistance protein MdtG [Candidatus Anstonella stagnisolia]
MSFKEIISVPGMKPVLFTLFMVSFGFGVILPMLPFYALSLGAQPFELGMLTATFALMSLLFSPIMGRLADKFGRKKILMLGTVGFAAAYVLFAFTDSLLLAFVARAIEGISASAMFPACISLISDFSDEKQRGRAMGLVGMSFSLGLIAGPAFGGLASSFAVKDAFLLSAFFSMLNFASIYLQVKEPKEKEESKDLGKQEVGMLEHIASPMLFLFLSSFMTTFMIGGLDATLAIYTGGKMGFTATQIGIVFTYIGVLIMVMQFVSGSIVNKYGEIRLVQVGLLLSGAGFFLLIFTHDWPTLMGALAVFVCGNALVFPSVNSLITKKVQGKRGAVLGLVSSFNSLGQMVGPLVGGFLYGINHDYAFLGMAAVIWGYCIFFTLFAAKKIGR